MTLLELTSSLRISVARGELSQEKADEIIQEYLTSARNRDRGTFWDLPND